MQQKFILESVWQSKLGQTKKAYFADGHCDSATVLSPQELAWGSKIAQLDFPRFTAWGDLQFFAFFLKNDLPPAELRLKLKAAIQAFKVALALSAKVENKNCQAIEILRSGLQLRVNHQPLALLSLEGADLLEDNPQTRLAFTRFLYDSGFRSFGLFWNNDNWAGCGANSNLTKQDTGLSKAGWEFAVALAEENWLLDFAHSSYQSFWDGAEILTQLHKPMLVTHACCNGLCPHQRNLTDNQLKKLGQMGGILGITLVPSFLANCSNQATIFRVAEHFKYAVNLAGLEAVALGSDFDGTDELPQGISGYQDLFKLAEVLQQVGFSENQIDKLMGENWRQFLRQNLE